MVLPDTWNPQGLLPLPEDSLFPPCCCSTATVPCSVALHRYTQPLLHFLLENLQQKTHIKCTLVGLKNNVFYISYFCICLTIHDYFLLFCSPGALTHRIRSFQRTGFTLSFWFSPVNSTSVLLPAASFFKRMNTSIELCQTDSTVNCSVWDALWKEKNGLLLTRLD